MGRNNRPIVIEIGEAIRNARVKRGLLQRDMARILGVSQGSLCSWEYGRNAPDERYWKKIREELNVNVADHESVIADQTRPVVDVGPSAFCRKLHDMRVARKMSVSQVRKLLGSKGGDIVRKWERGQALPTEEMLERLREVWGLDEDMEGLRALWETELDIRCKAIANKWKLVKPNVVSRSPTKRVIRVAFSRIIRDVWNAGYYEGKPEGVRKFIDAAASMLVGLALGKNEFGNGFETLMEESSDGTLTKRFGYRVRGKVKLIDKVFDFNWSHYLWRRGIVVRVVMEDTLEDTWVFDRKDQEC